MAMSLITVNYVRTDDDWEITVADGDQERTDRATGLISARNRAEALVQELNAEPDGRTVVHLLQGDAVAFTEAYLHAKFWGDPDEVGGTDSVAEGDARTLDGTGDGTSTGDESSSEPRVQVPAMRSGEADGGKTTRTGGRRKVSRGGRSKAKPKGELRAESA